MASSKCRPHLPRKITENSQILLSNIPLPPNASVAFVRFTPHATEQLPHRSIDLARQSIVNDIRQSGRGVVDSLLPVVCVGKEDTNLWVFSIHSPTGNTQDTNNKGETREYVNASLGPQRLNFDGLERSAVSYFSVSSLYPCSVECAKLPSSCLTCSQSPQTSSFSIGEHTTVSTFTTLFPRKSLRHIYSLFLDSIRDRLVDDICVPRTGLSLKRVPRATRLGHGFLSSTEYMYSLWGFGWEHRPQSAPLIHTALDISVSPTCIRVRPLPTTTKLLPIPFQCSPSTQQPTSNISPTNPNHPPPILTPGMPLLLAPYPTPAFYISSHPASSIPSSVRAQFWKALTGLGASLSTHDGRNMPQGSTSSKSVRDSSEPYILVYIPISNPQGETKGVAVLWPSHLAFIDASPSRIHLTSLPELPAVEGLLTPPRNAGSSRHSEPSLLCPTGPTIRRYSPLRCASPNLSRTLRSFRALELVVQKRIPGSPVMGTARRTAGYVESVAKERERERERANQERLRREREAREAKTPSTMVGSSQSSGAIAQASPPGESVKLQMASPSVPSEPTRPGPGWHSASTSFFTKAAQENVNNSFYPSPPDWDPNSSVADSIPNIPVAALAAATSGVAVSSPSNVKAPKPNNQSVSAGMDLGMDVDINDIGIDLGHSMNILDGNIDTTGLLDAGFGNYTDTFTDDDFNFFDTVQIPSTLPDLPPSLDNLGVTVDGMEGWLSNDDDNQYSNPQTITLSSGDPSSSEPSSLPVAIGSQDTPPPAPDLIPSSPAKTPSSIGNPATPSIDFNMPPPSSGRYMFDPIDFGNRHHLADVKYNDGKFALSHIIPRNSPSTNTSVSDGADRDDGWKLRYDAVTDPRIGVINRLRGIKRKLDERPFTSKVVLGRLRDEEWESIYTHSDEGYETESASSVDSEESLDEPDLDQDRGDDASIMSHPSRPSTPPPSGPYPLSVNLLYYHLEHVHLLPLGTPMRPSYEELVSTEVSHHPMSVPTPVSPAAALGSSSERNKTLEFLAQAMAKEVVENNLWAQAWGSAAEEKTASRVSSSRYQVSQTDLMHILILMKRAVGLELPLPLSSLLESLSFSLAHPPLPVSNTLQLLPQPKYSIGRAGLIHQMLPSAIRFWEKEGLGPRNGAKNVVAFAIFEGEERAPLIEAWLERVGWAYEARGLGTHTPGRTEGHEKGLVPVQFDTVRKTLPNLLASLPGDLQHIVIYIIAPPSLCSSLESPALRTIVKSQKCVSKLGGQHDWDQDRILIHFVPDYCVEDPNIYPQTRHVGLEYFVNSVYDRLLRVALRQTSRQLWEYSPAFENRFQVPAFTLARSALPQTQLQWDERPSLNALDRHTFLHVGYRLSDCKRWLLAACIDERGEAHEVAVWGVPNYDSQPLDVNWMVRTIWIFVKQFAQRADTEWRIVVAKLGEVSETEVKAWMSHLETMVSTNTGPPLHITLVCAQTDIPLPFLESEKTSSRPGPPGVTTVFMDASSVTYSAFFPQRMPIVSGSLLCPWEYSSFLTPSTSAGNEDDDLVPPPKIPVGILPLGTTALIRLSNDTGLDTLYIHLICAYKSAKSTLKKSTHEVHADITRNWYELSILTRDRWQFPRDGLPFHLAALNLMSRALDPDFLIPDAKDME